MKIIKSGSSNFFSATNTIAYLANLNKLSLNRADTAVNGLNYRESNENNSEKLPKWDLVKIPLKYYIENSYNDAKFLPQFVNTTDNSFLPWTIASCGLIRFQRIFNKNNADIIVEWTNTVVLGRDYECVHNDLKVVNNIIEKTQITIVIYPEIDKEITVPSRIERVRRTALH